MGLTWSNSGLFSTPGFIVSPVGKGERRKKKEKAKEKGRKEKGIENERKERRKEGWKEGIQNKKMRGNVRRRNFNKN